MYCADVFYEERNKPAKKFRAWLAEYYLVKELLLWRDLP